jgi:hypothetical protein
MDESRSGVEKPCGGCVHEPSITADEEGTVWGSDRDCETCIRMMGILKDNYQARPEVEKHPDRTKYANYDEEEREPV